VPRLSTFLVFAAASITLLLIPGPAVFYVVTRSVEQGRRLGLASVLGIHTGTLVHITAAAAGLSALLVSSALAFSVVKYAGAAYLIGIGIRRLLRPGAADAAEAAELTASPRRAFANGVLVQILNPKTALFFLAFLPPFLDPRRGPVFVQVVLLGVTFLTLGLVTDSAYALAAARLAQRWRNARDRRRTERLSGLVYIALGAAAAVSPRTAAHRHG
jgi:threonine/homoserine/homoserine lactone efflux protein